MTAEELAAAVGEDSDLAPVEKETTIRFAKPDARARVFTAEAGIMRRLLQHPHFQVGHVVTTDRGRVERVDGIDADEVQVVGVEGTIPVAALSVSASPRASDQHAPLVSEAVL